VLAQAIRLAGFSPGPSCLGTEPPVACPSNAALSHGGIAQGSS